jgi:peptidoglycan hydrolase-like protein with peptidoglycan-binding domain
MSNDIYNEAYEHFMDSGRRYEYGRGDISLRNRSENGRSDGSRTEQDLDGDGRRGVDCSSLVWRGLRNAGYDVGDTPFATSRLFNGTAVTGYAREHFDVVSAADARRPNGTLQPGDILMFRSSHGQHVGIFRGYDDAGNIQFLGSQVSTGPAVVARQTAPGQYWNGGDFEIVGALRAKPEFRVREPLHGRSEAAQEQRDPVRSAERSPVGDGTLRQGERGPEVAALQALLKQHGMRDAQGRELQADGDFGQRTREAVEAYQRANGLEADGIAGPRTLAALRQGQTQAATPGYRDDPMYQQALRGLEQLGPNAGFRNRQELENAAGTIAMEAKVTGLNRIDHVVASTNGSGLFAVQGGLNDPSHSRVHVDRAQAASQPLEQSAQQWQLASQQRHSQEQSSPMETREAARSMAM